MNKVMAERKATKRQPLVDKTLHRKIKTWTLLKPGEKLCMSRIPVDPP
jgi:hypothetical protein